VLLVGALCQQIATLMSLKALALSDLVLLVGALCQQIVPMLCDFASAGDSAVCLRRGYLQVYAWPVVCIAQMSSVWFAVLISTDLQADGDWTGVRCKASPSSRPSGTWPSARR